VTTGRAGYDGAINSAASGPVVLPNLTGTVSISGTPTVGLALTAGTGGLNGTGAISYQWVRGATAAGAFENISGATGAAYTPAAEDLGKYIRVTAGREGYNGAISSAATGPVEWPPLTGTVSISGTPTVELALTAGTGSLGGTGAISYQWARGATTGGAFANIAGATGATYTLTAADLGKYVRVTVSRAENTGTRTSAAAGPVEWPLTGTVDISGTPEVGSVLTANTGSLDGAGAISYKWQRSNSAAGPFADISGATGATYTLANADRGKHIRVTVTRAERSGTISSNTLKVPGVNFTVDTWINEDGNLLSDAPEDFIVISKSAHESLTVTAAQGMGNIRWRLNGTELSALRGQQKITIEAASYVPGFYNLSMYAEKTGGIPYQINITFVVDN
jgi:hypothetical protein